MRKRSNRNLLPYLVLNIIVSAATTLGVLFAWDALRDRDLPPPVSASEGSLQGGTAQPDPSQPAPSPSPTIPPDLTVIQISGVVGAGDINQEMVTLRRVGDGDLHMAGWQLMDESGTVYLFPQSPELVLFKDGAVQVYTQGGTDTATEVYWNRAQPVWEPNERIVLLDALGVERASYRVP
jgi:hypothetical protein